MAGFILIHIDYIFCYSCGLGEMQERVGQINLPKRTAYRWSLIGPP
jgi:hypothetical protein